MLPNPQKKMAANSNSAFLLIHPLPRTLSCLCIDHRRLAKWRKWRASDLGEAKEDLENELWRKWSNGRVGEWAAAAAVDDLGFTTLLTSQVISITFYSEREKSDKVCSEALISVWGFFTCRKSTTWDPRLYFPSEGSHTQDFYVLKKPIDSGRVWTR